MSNWRELAVVKRSVMDQEKWSARTMQPPPLALGDHVMIQNRAGNNPNKWDHRGVVTNVLPFDQHEVLVDGSRRLTLRNRKHLRRFTPVTNPLHPSVLPVLNETHEPSKLDPPLVTDTGIDVLVTSPQTEQPPCTNSNDGKSPAEVLSTGLSGNVDDQRTPAPQSAHQVPSSPPTQIPVHCYATPPPLCDHAQVQYAPSLTDAVESGDDQPRRSSGLRADT